MDVGPGDFAFADAETRAWFMRRVEFDTNGGCWLWVTGISSTGYGGTTFRGRRISAHRLSWQLNYGPIPRGLHVCHRCDVRACCNPAHLFLGTASDNMRDCRDKGRSNRPLGESAGNSILSEAQVAEIAARLTAGHTKKGIARDMGVPLYCVRSISFGNSWSWLTGIARHKVKDLPADQRPDRPSTRLLHNEQVAEVRRRALSGENQCAIAREFGISRRVVTMIRKGERHYRHLNEPIPAKILALQNTTPADAESVREAEGV